MADNFQRTGSVSNPHVGRDFENSALKALNANGVIVGIAGTTKIHKFDLGADDPAILVECKSHRWTKGSNVPSAKITVWNEAMYYFHCAPSHFRKIFFILKDERATTKESLSSYYIRTYGHLIPSGVEFWEFDEKSSTHEIIYGS